MLYELPTAGGFITTLWLTIQYWFSLLTILRQFPLSRFLNNVNIKILIQRNITSVVQKKALQPYYFFFVMFFVFSCVLTLTPAELLEAKAQNISILSYLANKFDNPYISYFAPLVAFFAITSSFFGHYLGAREGLEGLYLKMKGESVNRKKLNYGTAVFFLLTLWGVAIINPSILGLIESLGGPIIAMILFIMPMYAIRNVLAMKRYQGRFSNVFVTVMGLIAISAVVYGLL